MIFVSVSVFDAAQQAQFLKFQNEPSDSGIGRIAEILFQLLGGKFTGTVSGKYEVPKGSFLLRNFALGKCIIESLAELSGTLLGRILYVFFTVSKSIRFEVVQMCCAAQTSRAGQLVARIAYINVKKRLRKMRWEIV